MKPTCARNWRSVQTDGRGRRIQRIGIVVLVSILLAWPLSDAGSQTTTPLPSIPPALITALQSLGINNPEFLAVAVPPPQNEIKMWGTASPPPSINFNRFIHQPVFCQAPGPVKFGPNDDVEVVIIKMASPGNGIYCQRGGQCTSQ
jgi:hypothetical protein